MIQADDHHLAAGGAERHVAEGIVFRRTERFEPMAEIVGARDRLAFQVVERDGVDMPCPYVAELST